MSKYFENRIFNTSVEVNASEHLNLTAIVAFAAQATLLHYHNRDCPPLKVSMAKDEARYQMFQAGMAKTSVYNRVDAAFKVVTTMKSKCINHERLEDFRSANDDETKEAAISAFMRDMNIDGMADAVRWAKVGTPLTAAIRAELRTDTKAEKAAEADRVKLAKSEAKEAELAAANEALRIELAKTTAEKLAAMEMIEAEERAADEAKRNAALVSADAEFGADDATAPGQVIETETVTIAMDDILAFVDVMDEDDCTAMMLAINARLATLRDAAKEDQQIAA